VSLIAGVVMALTPLWVDLDTRGTWAMVIIGAVIAAVALAAMFAPGAYVGEGVDVVLGIAAFVAPWVFSFSDVRTAAWTAWIVGGVVVLTSGVAFPRSLQDRRHAPTAA
jgi:hypothetical protein